MSETKDFSIGAVLSVTTGKLLTEIGGVYEILNWMTGDNLFTHQLPRASREAKPVILRAHPALAEVDASHVNTDNWRTFLDEMVARFGETLAIPKMTTDEHERIDPLSELAEKVPPSRIHVVRVPARGETP